MALIGFVVTARLIRVFVFAYAKNRFSHDVAHLTLNEIQKEQSMKCCVIKPELGFKYMARQVP